MGARTPDAYRIGAGQVTQEYPADAVPARARKQPSLPTMSRAPESSPAEQAVTAEVAVVRRKASGAPRSSNDSRPSKNAAAVVQRQVAAREAAPAQAHPLWNLPSVSTRIWTRLGWPLRAISVLAFPSIVTGTARRCAS